MAKHFAAEINEALKVAATLHEADISRPTIEKAKAVVEQLISAFKRSASPKLEQYAESLSLYENELNMALESKTEEDFTGPQGDRLRGIVRLLSDMSRKFQSSEKTSSVGDPSELATTAFLKLRTAAAKKVSGEGDETPESLDRDRRFFSWLKPDAVFITSDGSTYNVINIFPTDSGASVQIQDVFYPQVVHYLPQNDLKTRIWKWIDPRSVVVNEDLAPQNFKDIFETPNHQTTETVNDLEIDFDENNTPQVDKKFLML